MNFFVKKTFDLTPTEREQLHRLFLEVFGKERSINAMFNQYTQNPLGYSYHSFCVVDGVICGAATYVPSHFLYHGHQYTFATGIDVMIAEKHRNFFEFRKIIKNVFKALKADGIPLIYGYPNDNSHAVYKTAGLMQDIGKMRIYCLPYRIGGIKSSLKVMNWFSQTFARCLVAIDGWLASETAIHYPISKDASSYDITRYKRLEGEYSHAQLTSNCTLHYTIRVHDGIRTAFIIDLTEKSERNFVRASQYLLRNERNNFDLILYPGYLPFRHHGLLCVPRSMEPKNFYFAAQILDPSCIRDDVWSINNWDTNLAMYDLV